MFIKLTHDTGKFSYLIPANQIERITESTAGGCTVILKENKTVDVIDSLDEIHAQLQPNTHKVIYEAQTAQEAKDEAPQLEITAIKLAKENEKIEREVKELKANNEKLLKRFEDEKWASLNASNEAYLLKGRNEELSKQLAETQEELEKAQEETPKPSPDHLRQQSHIDLGHLQRAMGLEQKKMSLEQMYDWCRNHRQYRGYLFQNYQNNSQVSEMYDQNHKLVSSLPDKPELEYHS